MESFSDWYYLKLVTDALEDDNNTDPLLNDDFNIGSCRGKQNTRHSIVLYAMISLDWGIIKEVNRGAERLKKCIGMN